MPVLQKRVVGSFFQNWRVKPPVSGCCSMPVAQRFLPRPDCHHGIPEDIRFRLLVYLMPIVGAVAGAALIGSSGTDLQAMVGAVAGLLAGAWLVRMHSTRSRNDLRYNPVLIDSAADLDPAIIKVP